MRRVCYLLPGVLLVLGGLTQGQPSGGVHDHLQEVIWKLTPLTLEKDQYFARSVYRDSVGFTWIGLQNSVLCFDGVTFEEYIYHPETDTGMLNDGPDILAEDRDGNIWMGSWTSGLAIWSKTRGTVSRFRSDPADPTALYSDEITDILMDEDGSVWVTTRDFVLHRYDLEAGRFRRYQCTLPPLAAEHHIARAHFGQIASDPVDPNMIWIGSQFGVFGFHKQEHTFRYIPIDTFVSNRYDVVPSPVYVDDIHQLWFGHYNRQGLKVLDLNTEKWIRRYAIDKEFDLSDGSNRMFHIYPFNDSLIIANSWWNHLYLVNRYKLDQFAILPYYGRRRNNLGMYVDHVTSTMLIGMDSKILYYEKRKPRFSFFYFGEYLTDADKGNFQMDLLYDDKRSQYLISTRGGDGVLKVSEKLDDVEVVRYKSRPGFEHLDVDMEAMTQCGDTVWLATNEGLLILDLITDQITPATSIDPITDEILRRPLSFITDNQHGLWLCLQEGGIIRLRSVHATGQPKRYFESLIIKKMAFVNDSICVGATSKGLQLMNLNSGEILKSYSDKRSVRRLSEFEVWDFELVGDTIWVGTLGNGLAKMIRIGNNTYQTQFFISDVVGVNNVNGVLVTDNNEIWTASNYGFSYLDPITGELESFGVADGSGFARRGPWLHQLRDGRICASANGGFHWFRSGELRESYDPVKPYLKSVEVLGKKVLLEHADGSSWLHLRAADDHIALHMGALNTNGPTPTNVYRYKLVGYDPEWITSYTESVAKYTNLPGGAYEFQFTASPKGSRWSPDIVSIPIEVEPPFFESGRFKLMLGLLTIVASVLTWYFLQQRRKEKLQRLHRESQLLFLQKEHAEAELTALRAQMNPHFLFNSLNSINWYIVKNKPKIASQYIVKFSRLVRLILDHSKSDLITLEDEVEALGLYIELEAMRFEDSFHSAIDIDKSINVKSTAIPPLIIQPFVENAIWHGLLPKPGEKRLEVRVYRDQDELCIDIEDNGIGRVSAKAHQSRFQPPSRGIEITRRRIDRHLNGNGSQAGLVIQDLSHNGHPTGTCVRIRLPLVNS